MSGVGPLTALMVQSELEAINRLRGILEKDGISTREQFWDVMAAAFSYGGLELRVLADDLAFSFSTVFRWQQGRSAPHPSLWPVILTWILGALRARSHALIHERAA